MLNLTKKAAFTAAGVVAVLGAGGTAWAVDSASTATSGQVPAAANLAVSGTSGASGASGATGAGGTGGVRAGTGAGAATPAKGARGRRLRGLLSRADHGTVEIRTKNGWETVDFDRGRVTASSATSITLSRPDGQSVTEAITSSTKFVGSGSQAVVGRPATVISLNGDALRVRQANPASKTPAGAPAGVGGQAGAGAGAHAGVGGQAGAGGHGQPTTVPAASAASATD